MTKIFSNTAVIILKIGLASVLLLMLSFISAIGIAQAKGTAPIFKTTTITNEKIVQISPSSVLVKWNTDIPASSRVVYGLQSKEVKFSFNLNNPNHGYGFSTSQSDTLRTSHEMIITELVPNAQYFFRVESRVDNFAQTGGERVILLATDNLNSLTECDYLKSYLRMGYNNDAGEVVKLQTFLRDFEGFNSLNITGVFDQDTFDAVSAFQVKYADEVLVPWGVDAPTGFVYLTTQKKINEIKCGKNFPLNENQLSEIEEVRDIFEGNNKASVTTGSEGLYEQIGAGEQNETSNVAITEDGDEYENDNEYENNQRGSAQQASVGNAKVTKSLFSRFLDLFR